MKPSVALVVLDIQESDMLKRLTRNILFFCFFVFSHSASAQLLEYEPALDDDSINFTYNLFEADRFFLQDNFEFAENYYQLCLNQRPENAFVLFRLATISYQNKELASAVNYIDRCLAYNDTNIWYLFLAGNIYTTSKLTVKAEAIFTRLIQKDPSVLDFYICLSDVYIQDKRYKDAIKVYDSIESKFGIDETIIIQKKNLYLTLKNKKKARAEIEKLISAFPDDIQYKRLLSEFYLQTGDIQKSISIYNEILSANPNDGYSHIGLAGCYQYLNNKDKFNSELIYIFKSQDISCEVKVNILVDILRSIKSDNVDDFNNALNLAELLVRYYPEDPDVNTIFADFQMNLGNIDIARTALNKVIENRKDKFEIWRQLLFIEYQLFDWISVYKHSNEAIDYFPNQPFLYYMNGLSSFQLSKNEQAKKSFEFCYGIITKSDPLFIDCLTFLGETYYRLDSKKDAYECFDKVLVADPENIMVLNNYSYYLSLDKENLDKALEMSKITITKEPENSTYLDTYAWILFEKGKYIEALTYIERAVNFDLTHSDVIIEHYGDILYYNDEIESAVEQWKRAKLIGKGNGKLDEKIESHKYIE